MGAGSGKGLPLGRANGAPGALGGKVSPVARGGAASVGGADGRGAKLGPLPRSDGSPRSGKLAEATLGGAGKAGIGSTAADGGLGFRGSKSPSEGAATPGLSGLYYNGAGGSPAGLTKNTPLSNAIAANLTKSGNWNGDWSGNGSWGHYDGYGSWGYCGGWGGWGGWGCGGWWGGFGCGWPYFGIGFGWGCDWRFSLGFGYGYYPGWCWDSWYPYYRCYSYYPYHYYSTIGYYPVYGTVYHSDAYVTDYADVSDPYVELTEEPTSRQGGIVPVASDQIPDALRAPLHDGFPAGLAQGELAFRAESAMRAGNYLDAAEARRRQLSADPTNPAVALHLGIALFAAGRYELASVALNYALDLDPRIVSTSDLASVFGAEDRASAALRTLEKHVVKNPTDGSARFVLGCMNFAAGRYFAARNEFSLLKEAAPDTPHVAALLAESDRKFLESAPATETR
jgi:hypothetical protein